MPVQTPFSQNITFTWDKGDPADFLLVLTGNVLTSILDQTIGIPPNTEFTFIIQQNSVGGWTFAWPSICRGANPVGDAANQITIQKFKYLSVQGGPLLVASQPAMYI